MHTGLPDTLTKMIPRVRARSAHQELALAVIEQGFRDAANPTLSQQVRNDARRFITGSPMLMQWCHLANLEPAFVSDVVARCLRGQFELVSPQSPSDSGRPVAVPRRVAVPRLVAPASVRTRATAAGGK